MFSVNHSLVATKEAEAPAQTNDDQERCRVETSLLQGGVVGSFILEISFYTLSTICFHAWFTTVTLTCRSLPMRSARRLELCVYAGAAR